jgi:N-acetylmuramoyl-L-alanine amidase
MLAALALPCVSQTVVVAAPPDQVAAPLPGVINRMTVVLDAAHGGADGGARIGDSLHEKDITLSLALKLQALLATRGFAIVMTRTSDVADRPNAPGMPMTLDDRAGLANHARASACLLIHAAASGKGVHLFASELDSTSTEAAVLPWATAQSSWVAESVHLERQLSEALRQSGVARIASRASVRPVDSLTCPAVVIELAPETEDLRSVNDNSYQQRVAQSIAGALDGWSKQVQPPNKLAPVSKPRPAPKPISPPIAKPQAPEVQP